MKNTTKKMGLLVLATTSSLYSTQSIAAGFALAEQNASGLGNAYAGASAVANDASTIFHNPAGMTRLPKNQLVFAGNIVAPTAEFSNGNSTLVNTASLSGNNDTSEEIGFLPAFFYASQINENLYWGVGVSVPFGLATEYEWLGRSLSCDEI